jgi:hypothetical protein
MQVTLTTHEKMKNGATWLAQGAPLCSWPHGVCNLLPGRPNASESNSETQAGCSDMRWMLAIAAAWLVVGLEACLAAQSHPTTVLPRSELSIQYRQVRGITFAWTTLIISHKAIDVLVDTGSTGLVLLASAVDDPQALPKGNHVYYSYANGDRFDGRFSRVTVQFSQDVTATIPVALMTSATCIPSHPKCDVGGDFAQYRLGGPGRFGAVLGIGIRFSNNPFVDAGISRWIVDIPHNRIVLNPDDRDLDGFVFHHRVAGAEHLKLGFESAIPGCLVAGTKRICGPTLLDTGNSRVRVASTDKSALNEVLAAGHGKLVFGEGDQAQTVSMAISGIVRLEGPDYTTALGNALSVGTPIVKDLAIAYDPADATIGIRPRQ